MLKFSDIRKNCCNPLNHRAQVCLQNCSWNIGRARWPGGTGRQLDYEPRGLGIENPSHNIGILQKGGLTVYIYDEWTFPLFHLGESTVIIRSIRSDFEFLFHF